MYHLTHDEPNPPWKHWNGPLTRTTGDIITSFLSSLLNTHDDLPDYATHIAQLPLSAGGLGLLCPRLRAAPDFVLTMTTVYRRATTGFYFYRSLAPHTLHPSLRSLFTIESNPSSLFLQRLHRLVPHFARIATAPTTPSTSRLTTFLTSTSPKSARDRIKKYCTTFLHHATHHEFARSATEHLHLLPSLLSPHTSHILPPHCDVPEQPIESPPTLDF
jgi:hypothetical protein